MNDLARGRRLVRATALLTVLVAVVAASARNGPAAVAQEAQQRRLAVTAFTPWVDLVAGEDPEAPAPALEVRAAWRHEGDEDLVDARLVVEVHAPVSRRSELWERLRVDAELGRPVATAEAPLPDLRPGETGGAAVTVDLGRLRSAGVHPTTVSVARGTQVLGAVTTVAVTLDEALGDVEVVLAVPLDGPPLRGADDAFTDRLRPTWGDDGRLTRLTRELGRLEVPVSVLLGAHVVEDVAALEAAGDELGVLQQRRVQLRNALAVPGHEVLPSVYAGADLAALVAAGEPAAVMAAELVREGGRRLELLEPDLAIDDATFTATSPLSGEVLDLVTSDRVLLPTAVLAGDLGDLGRALLGPRTALPDAEAETLDGLDARRGVAGPGTRLLPAAVVDPVLADALADPSVGPVVATQWVLGHTALAAAAGGRALVAVPPLDWDPPAGLLTRTATALADAPWVAVRTVDRVLAGSVPAALPRAQLRERPQRVSPAQATRIGAASTQLVGVVAAIPGATNDVQGRNGSSLYDQLLRASSHWLAGSQEAVELVADVEEVVDAAFGSVEVRVPPITLTSDRGQIPIGLRRTAGGPLVVRVEVEASSGGLTWPEGRERTVTLAADGAASVPFVAEARSRGEFPVTVRVTDPNQLRELTSARIAVSSTAISRPALVTVVLLAVILLALGRWRRRRRESERRPAHLRVVPSPERDTGRAARAATTTSGTPDPEETS